MFRNAQPGDRITFSPHVSKQFYFDTCDHNSNEKDFFATWVEKDLFCFRYQGKNKLYSHTLPKQYTFVETLFMHEKVYEYESDSFIFTYLFIELYYNHMSTYYTRSKATNTFFDQLEHDSDKESIHSTGIYSTIQ